MLGKTVFLLRQRIPCERGEHGQVQNVDGGYRAGSSDCGPNKVPLVSASHQPSLRCELVDVLRSFCEVVQTFQGFALAVVSTYALTIVCVFFTSVCTTCEIMFLNVFGNSALQLENLDFM